MVEEKEEEKIVDEIIKRINQYENMEKHIESFKRDNGLLKREKDRKLIEIEYLKDLILINNKQLDLQAQNLTECTKEIMKLKEMMKQNI